MQISFIHNNTLYNLASTHLPFAAKKYETIYVVTKVMPCKTYKQELIVTMQICCNVEIRQYAVSFNTITNEVEGYNTID